MPPMTFLDNLRSVYKSLRVNTELPPKRSPDMCDKNRVQQSVAKKPSIFDKILFLHELN